MNVFERTIVIINLMIPIFLREGEGVWLTLG